METSKTKPDPQQDKAYGLNIPPTNAPLEKTASTSGTEPSTASPPRDPGYERPIPSGADPQKFIRGARKSEGVDQPAEDDPHRKPQ